MKQLKFSYLIYIALIFFILGLILAPSLIPKAFEKKEDHLTHMNHEHHMNSHEQLEVDSGKIPNVDLQVVKDLKSGWNIYVNITNFEFTPENVNLDNLNNQGHAHIYIDSIKLTRLYSNYYYLGDLPFGEHEIMVTLNSNKHEDLIYNGSLIMDKVNIIQN